MRKTSTYTRNERSEWRPQYKIVPAPINDWPPRFGALARWMFSFPGYLWPLNLFWVGITLATWTWLTPALEAMQTFELWWVSLILCRNLALTLLLFGGLHLYLHVFHGQGSSYRFTLKPLATNSGRFLFRNQVFDNMLRTLFSAVPIFTGFEILTYWGFANGYLGYPGVAADPFLFWGWFIFLLLMGPVIHSIHFYLGHRLLHKRWLYLRVHALHHHNVEVGPWSGLAMHPVEHAIYFSTVIVQWLMALHPVNALFQIQLAIFNAATAHTGFERIKFSDWFTIEGGSHFHYLHHKHFECNYGGSLVVLDRLFGTFHDGSEAGDAVMRQRLRAISRA